VDHRRIQDSAGAASVGVEAVAEEDGASAEVRCGGDGCDALEDGGRGFEQIIGDTNNQEGDDVFAADGIQSLPSSPPNLLPPHPVPQP
jgi:hypothetical protein